MEDKSYGVIPVQKTENKITILLIQHTAGHWGLPKGHAEKGENEFEAASRELHEETGLTVSADELRNAQSFQEYYEYERDGIVIKKEVLYFLSFTSQVDVVIQKKEVKDYQWCTLNVAASKVTFPALRSLLKEVAMYLQAN